MRILPVNLVSVPMTETELARERRRRGYWLRLARAQTEYGQNDIARMLGLKAGTTILAWEKGRRDPKASQLLRLAEIYGVPVSMFADPEPTDEERVLDARAELARAAILLASEDAAEEAAGARGGDAPREARPGRRSA